MGLLEQWIMQDSEHSRFSSMVFYYVNAGGNIVLSIILNNFHFLLKDKIKEHWQNYERIGWYGRENVKKCKFLLLAYLILDMEYIFTLHLL